MVLVAYAQFIKHYRKKTEKRIQEILFNAYLDHNKNSIITKVNKSKSERIVKNINIEYDGKNNDILITASNNNLSLIIYFFNNEKCVGFYIQSFEEKYSLPYWKYKNKFVDSQEEKRMPDRKMHGELAVYTANEYLSDIETKILQFDEEIDWYFKNYFELSEKRYLCLAVDMPNLFRRSDYPLYMYLLSSNASALSNIRSVLFEKYQEILLPYIVDINKMHKYL